MSHNEHLVRNDPPFLTVEEEFLLEWNYKSFENNYPSLIEAFGWGKEGLNKMKTTH